LETSSPAGGLKVDSHRPVQTTLVLFVALATLAANRAKWLVLTSFPDALAASSDE
jgi:hypothetical protein